MAIVGLIPMGLDAHNDHGNSHSVTRPCRKELAHARRSGIAPFLLRLYEILSNETPDIIGWNFDGKAFEIRNKDLMVDRVLPKYFNNKNFSSFQRQLNYFGFRKWSKFRSPVCTYSREHFVRGNFDDLKLVKRQSKSSKAFAGITQSPSKNESSFTSQSVLSVHDSRCIDTEKPKHSLKRKSEAMSTKGFDDNCGGHFDTHSSAKFIPKLPSIADLLNVNQFFTRFPHNPLGPSSSPCLLGNKSSMNSLSSLNLSKAHGLKLAECGKPTLAQDLPHLSSLNVVPVTSVKSDIVITYSTSPTTDEAAQPIPSSNVLPNFLKSLFELVQEGAEKHDIVEWVDSGKAFEIKDVDRFTKELLPFHFKHQRFSSFQRQLNMYGFKKWTKSKTMNCTYSHPCFQENSFALLHQIKRKTNPQYSNSRQ